MRFIPKSSRLQIQRARRLYDDIDALHNCGASLRAIVDEIAKKLERIERNAWVRGHAEGLEDAWK